MTKEQAINYLYSSGMSEEQVKTVVEALEQKPYDDAKYHEEHGEVVVDKAVWIDAERAISREYVVKPNTDYAVGVDSTGRFVKASEVSSYHLSAPYQFR